MTKMTDDQLREALYMVEEARDYMAMLPPVPATLHLVHKLSGFLQAHRSQDLPWHTLPWTGTGFDHAGRPLLNAMLLDTTLTLRQASVGQLAKLTSSQLQQHLTAGITMQLKRPEGPF